MKFDELIEHYENAIGFESTVKGVPMSEENLELCRKFVTDIHDCPRQDVRVMYRGPRTGLGNRTLKKMHIHLMCIVLLDEFKNKHRNI